MYIYIHITYCLFFTVVYVVYFLIPIWFTHPKCIDSEIPHARSELRATCGSNRGVALVDELMWTRWVFLMVC